MLRKPRASACWATSIPREKISCEERPEGDCISKKVPNSMVSGSRSVSRVACPARRPRLSGSRRRRLGLFGRRGRPLSEHVLDAVAPEAEQEDRNQRGEEVQLQDLFPGARDQADGDDPEGQEQTQELHPERGAHLQAQRGPHLDLPAGG